jgi:hypothetical protein
MCACSDGWCSYTNRTVLIHRCHACQGKVVLQHMRLLDLGLLLCMLNLQRVALRQSCYSTGPCKASYSASATATADRHGHAHADDNRALRVIVPNNYSMTTQATLQSRASSERFVTDAEAQQVRAVALADTPEVARTRKPQSSTFKLLSGACICWSKVKRCVPRHAKRCALKSRSRDEHASDQAVLRRYV